MTHRLVPGHAVTVVTYALKHRASGRRTALDIPELALGVGGAQNRLMGGFITMQASVKWGYYTGSPGRMNGVQWRPGVPEDGGCAGSRNMWADGCYCGEIAQRTLGAT